MVVPGQMVRVCLLSTCVCLLALTTAFSPQGSDERAVRSDIQYIRCGVCEALAKNAHRQIKTLRDERTKPGKLSEIEILEKIEKMTDPVAEEGEWITRTDLVQRGSALILEEQPTLGVCGAACKTIARAAEEILGEHDTDLGEVLWKGEAGRAGVTAWLCKEITASCLHEPPPLPRGRKPSAPFQKVDKEELNMQRMMAAMEGTGMRSSLYSRDEAERMAGMPEGDEDSDEDEGAEAETAEGTSTATGQLLSNLQGSLATGLTAARDAVGPVLDRVLPALEKGWDGVSSAIKSLAKRISPAQQMQPPHVEL